MTKIPQSHQLHKTAHLFPGEKARSLPLIPSWTHRAKTRPPAHPWRGPRELCRKWAHRTGWFPALGEHHLLPGDSLLAPRCGRIWHFTRSDSEIGGNCWGHLQIKAAPRAPIHREPRNSCLNPNMWFELTQTSHVVFLTQVLCIMRLILKLLFITKQLFFIYNHCKPYAVDMLRVCFHPFSFTSFRLRPGRCYQNKHWFAEGSGELLKTESCGCWRDWGREELAGLAAYNGRWYLGHERT